MGGAKIGLGLGAHELSLGDENGRSRGSVCAEKRLVGCVDGENVVGLGAHELGLCDENDRSRGSVCAEKHIVSCVDEENEFWAHMSSVWVMRTTEVAATLALVPWRSLLVRLSVGIGTYRPQ